ncbi:hypothetical protein P168DRAFT_131553 [Aspergillus campestris IBT 28561]|uniref:Uncharacterized protein n=1 Tax=Aspergillus campestris (strain IBT 28561) TaxID=1392248 RepID=A0A2I1D7L7_ASPC2|nr:uncharacterized protein P168DRAFT_131553 [Aspergillus campestris IBT 28561]PKY05853.1 hypothetical protein P168DRAFT_131553 [Aspergillus campestris IBT 28561]
MSKKTGVNNVSCASGFPLARETGSVTGSSSQSDRLIKDINNLLSSVPSSRAQKKPIYQSRPPPRCEERVRANQGVPRNPPMPSRPRQPRHQTPPQKVSPQPSPHPVKPAPNSRVARHPATIPRRKNDGDVEMAGAPGTKPKRPRRNSMPRGAPATRVVDVEMRDAPPLPIVDEVLSVPSYQPHCVSITYCHGWDLGTDENVEMTDAPPLME